MAPCARCSYIGTQCVTGSPGQPGRPPKQRLVGTPRSGVTTSTNASSPLRNVDHVEVHTTPTTSPARGSRCRADGNILGHRADLPAPKSTLYYPHSPREAPSVHEQQPDFWAATGDSSAFFRSPSIDQSLAPGEEMLSLVQQLSNPSRLPGLFSPDDELSATLPMGSDPSTALNMNLDLLPSQSKNAVMPLTPLPQYFSAASSLVGFRDEIDHRISTVEEYYSEPNKVLQRCKDEGTAAGPDVENPAALLLTCTKKLINIIQNVTTPTAQQLQTQPTEDTLSTEIVLLALSSYLSLMRLFDSLFHRIHKFLCQVSPESYESIKVKSVLRIGGVSTLQDMPLKVYAMGILDAIQSQVQTLERCMGIPAEYCLSGKGEPTPAGILNRADRARLFWVVVAQEDVKSRRGCKSYVESIRASIKESLAFLDE
ncbi:uncharacterized protein BJX67DRAFT_379623 [Aspergillus lucknowensis]|uniref:Uncharacterized protein n=1 Tax=Aspergillus lucknowensis TaxID=176173 RepID=A0ABR4LX82_9EURO